MDVVFWGKKWSQFCTLSFEFSKKARIYQPGTCKKSKGVEYDQWGGTVNNTWWILKMWSACQHHISKVWKIYFPTASWLDDIPIVKPSLLCSVYTHKFLLLFLAVIFVYVRKLYTQYLIGRPSPYSVYRLTQHVARWDQIDRVIRAVSYTHFIRLATIVLTCV